MIIGAHTRILGTLLLVVSLVGFFDAAYLTGSALQGVIPPCTVDGCEIVLTSEYSRFLGIPISLFGALAYFSVLIAALLYLTKRDERARFFLKAITALMFLVSLGLVGLQLFVIEAICLYCMVSAGTSTLLFVFSWMLARGVVENKIPAERGITNS